MASGENRFSRWSRLKRQGGADAREERQAADDAKPADVAEADPAPFAANLPGGRLKRRFVPAMPPLAAAEEEGDDRLTKGIGHELLVEPGSVEPGAADASPTDPFADIETRPLTEEEEKAVAALPPIEELTKDSDFTPFMQAGIPDFIKRRALRALWRSDPLFAFRDGMNEYDDDFNILHKTIESTFGSYKVGRGHLSEEELREMMPEEARHAFDEDEENEDEDALKSASDEGDSPEGAADDGAPEDLGEIADDDLGDGEDEPQQV